MKMKYKESDMYAPIRDLLAGQGFTVRGEVKGCDISAIRDEALWIIEMKLHANITLIYQAMARQDATGWVFIAIPRPRNARDGNFLKLKKCHSFKTSCNTKAYPLSVWRKIQAKRPV